MFYFYNQFLETILTAERWATAEDLQSRPHSFLSSPTLAEGKEVLSRLKSAFGRENAKYIMLLKEERAKKASKWPTRVPTSKGNATIMTANHGAIITHLLKNERGFVHLRESSSLFPLPQSGGESVPVVVEDVQLFDVILPQVTVEVMPELTEETPKKEINFHEIHRNFGEEKQLSMVEADGKVAFLKSSLQFSGYKLAEEINEVNGKLQGIYQDIDDIFRSYGDILHHIDSQIEDELHFIEFSTVSASQCIHSYRHLQELRVKRRCIKDSIQLAELLAQNLGTDLPQRLSHVSEKIQQWDQRSYMLRVPEEFNH